MPLVFGVSDLAHVQRLNEGSAQSHAPASCTALRKVHSALRLGEYLRTAWGNKTLRLVRLHVFLEVSMEGRTS